jgi:hypothetical protein
MSFLIAAGIIASTAMPIHGRPEDFRAGFLRARVMSIRIAHHDIEIIRVGGLLTLRPLHPWPNSPWDQSRA